MNRLKKLKKVNWDKLKKGDYIINLWGMIFEFSGLKKYNQGFNNYSFIFRLVNPDDGEPKNQAIELLSTNSEKTLRFLCETLPVMAKR